MPRVAILTAVVVAAVVLGLVFTRSDGGSTKTASKGEVFLQAADKTGPDPFTKSSATENSAPPVSASPAASEPANAVRGVDGGAPGLYGGTQNVSACDVEQQIKALQAAPAKNMAFASVAGVQPAGVPAYLRSLTPVQLRMDTRVTNHGYRDGAATSYQAVLQAGTAVLVDNHGVPRVRCLLRQPADAARRPADHPEAHRRHLVLVPPAERRRGHPRTPDHQHLRDLRPPQRPLVRPPPRRHGEARPPDPAAGEPGQPLRERVPSACASTAPGTPGTPGASPSPCPPSSSAPSSPSSLVAGIGHPLLQAAVDGVLA